MSSVIEDPSTTSMPTEESTMMSDGDVDDKSMQRGSMSEDPPDDKVVLSAEEESDEQQQQDVRSEAEIVTKQDDEEVAKQHSEHEEDSDVGETEEEGADDTSRETQVVDQPPEADHAGEETSQAEAAEPDALESDAQGTRDDEKSNQEAATDNGLEEAEADDLETTAVVEVERMASKDDGHALVDDDTTENHPSGTVETAEVSETSDPQAPQPSNESSHELVDEYTTENHPSDTVETAEVSETTDPQAPQPSNTSNTPKVQELLKGADDVISQDKGEGSENPSDSMDDVPLEDGETTQQDDSAAEPVEEESSKKQESGFDMEEGSDAMVDVTLEGSETTAVASKKQESGYDMEEGSDAMVDVTLVGSKTTAVAAEEEKPAKDEAASKSTEEVAPPSTPVRRRVLRQQEEALEPPSPSITSESLELPTLEECLYGPSPRNATSEEFDPPDGNQPLVDDDWDFVREQGLWKTKPHVINMNQLRKIASQHGIAEEGSHRAVTWRVLLGYLPPDNTEWESLVKEKREQYRGFVKTLFQNASDCWNGEELRWKRRRPRARRVVPSSHHDDSESSMPEDIVEEKVEPLRVEEKESQISSPMKRQLDKKGLDRRVLEGVTKDINALHIDQLRRSTAADVSESDEDGDNSTDLSKQKSPESMKEEASYDDFVDSAKLLDEIRKDVDRTFPDLAFFLDPERNLGRRRYAAMERILFVWSKYNKGVKYVQGMNEIVGTIYYVLANDWNSEWACEAEADTYWIFSVLLEDMRDVFVPDLDDADTGIQGRIQMLEALLKRHDPEVKEHLDEVGVECSFFAIRWWTTLLTREFLLPDTIRLWDSMFASTHKDNFLCYVCVSMVIMIRDILLKGDFSHCLRTLQSYPSVLMDNLLISSRALWVYERQITVACRKGGISLHQALSAVRPPPSIIMAFGFQRGIVAAAPMTRAEKLEQASERAAASVRDATNAVAASAKGWFGSASRLYNRYKIKRSASSESNQSSERGSTDGIDIVNLDDDADCVYMQAIQGAETGKFSYK